MEPSPRTYRPHVLPDRPLEHMQWHQVDSVLVTTSSGELVGVLTREVS